MLTITELERHRKAHDAWAKIIDGLLDLRKAQGYLDEEQCHWLEVAAWEMEKAAGSIKMLSERL